MFDPSGLIASFIVGGAGYMAFVYGKGQARLSGMVIGIALMGFPYFVDTVWLIYVIGALLLALLWVALKLDY